MTYQELNELINSDLTPKVPKLLLSLFKAVAYMDPIQFENFVFSIFEVFGFKGELTPNNGDEGIDLILYEFGSVIIVQCKRFNNDLKVGSKELRDFLGAMFHTDAIHGYFITTSSFTDQAKSYCVSHKNITLIDFERLERMFRFAMLLSLDEFERIPKFNRLR